MPGNWLDYRDMYYGSKLCDINIYFNVVQKKYQNILDYDTRDFGRE